MSAFLGLLNRTITVKGLTDTGTTDGTGTPIYTTTTKGTVKGRIDPKGGLGRDGTEVVNGPNLNPVISDFVAYTAMPVGFSVAERDTLTDTTGDYEVLGVATLDGRAVAHHLEITLRRVAA